jgi:hypothetical protein
VVGADVGPGGGDRAAAERDEEAATGLEGSSGGHGGGGWFRGGAAISDGGVYRVCGEREGKETVGPSVSGSRSSDAGTEGKGRF